MHVRTPFPYPGDGWAHFAETCWVVRSPLAIRFTQVMGGVYLHVRTCAPIFHISGTARRIGLEFGMWLGIHKLCIFHKPRGIHLHVRTCASILHVLETAGYIGLKLDMWLGIRYQIYFPYAMSDASVHAFVHVPLM